MLAPKGCEEAIDSGGSQGRVGMVTRFACCRESKVLLKGGLDNG